MTEIEATSEDMPTPMIENEEVEPLPKSALHLITSHRGEPHVSADDSAKLTSLTLGAGRYVMEGFDVRISSATSVVVESGCVLVDGRFIRLSTPEVVTLENGQLGRNRIDQLRIRYECFADGREMASFIVVTGTPSSGPASVPVNEYDGNILNLDRIVDIPLANLPKSGLTPGTPVRLIQPWVWPPSNTDMTYILNQINQVLSEGALANAQAWEIVRSIPAELERMSDEIDGMDRWLKEEQAQNRRDIEQLMAMVAGNVGNYVIMGDALAGPSTWIEYTKATETVRLAYSSYDESSHEFTINESDTIDYRVDETHALAVKTDGELQELKETVDANQSQMNAQLNSIKKQVTSASSKA